MENKRWKKRPEDSNWGDFGEDDQLGRLNLITKEKVLEGVAEVKEGRSFCLSLPLDYPGGQVINQVRHPPILKPVIRNESPYFNYRWDQLNSEQKDIGSDDQVLLHTQYSTQWDSLAHRGKMFDVMDDGNPQPVYYNGFQAGEDITMVDKETSAEALGVENMAEHGVQGRGVLVDLFSEYGEFPRKEVGYDDLMYIMDKDNITVEEGDILCLWTGLDQMIMRMEGDPDPSIKKACAVLDGFDQQLLKWIADSGVAAITSDNLAVEAVGKEATKDSNDSNLPLHELCLFRLGIHLGELWHLADLAKWLKENNRSRFLLTAPPLRLTGAVGSPVTPIATV